MDETELHLEIEGRLASNETIIKDLGKRMEKVELTLSEIAHKDDIMQLISTIKSKNASTIAAVIGALGTIGAGLFAILK